MRPMEISTTLTTEPVADERLAEILASPGFGSFFTDHMYAVRWNPGDGWHDAEITPYGPLTLDPATAVFHYAQEIFEGLKAYRHDDGSIWAFRPDANAERMQRSSRRLALPGCPSATSCRPSRSWCASIGAGCRRAPGRRASTCVRS